MKKKATIERERRKLQRIVDETSPGEVKFYLAQAMISALDWAISEGPFFSPPIVELGMLSSFYERECR